MRTTLTIEDSLVKKLQSIARRSGRSFKDVVNETLRAGLAARPARKPYRLKPASLGGAVAGVDLRRALVLADSLEDLEVSRKLDARK